VQVRDAQSGVVQGVGGAVLEAQDFIRARVCSDAGADLAAAVFDLAAKR